MPPAESLSFWRAGLSDEDRATAMVRSQKLIAELSNETYRRDRDIDNVRLFESNPVVTLYNFAGRYYAEGGSTPLAPPDDSTNNKAKAAIDTLMSQVASTDQRARCKVTDGDWRQRRRGRKLQTFCDGLAYELKLHKLRKRAAIDAAVLESGVGVLQFFRDGDRCDVQRIIATELSIDPADGLIDGVPQTIYRRRPYPRDKVIADFAKDNEPLKELIGSMQVRSVSRTGAPSDDVEVFEAWHLPTEKGGEDGWHVIALDTAGGLLLCEPYAKMKHTMVFFSWEDRFTTSWGLSLMTQARKLQRRINANSYRIDRAQKLFHAGHLYVPREMKLDKGQLSNEVGSSWVGNGPNPPKQILFQAASKEMYDQVERDGQRIFENLGINQDEAEADTGAGLDASGAALRERTKKSAKRQSMRQQRWEAFHIDCIQAALGIVRDIVEKTEDGKDRGAKSGYKVSAPGDRNLSVLDWKEVAIDESDYVLEIKPASPVPTDPDGLMAYGKEMVDAGAWTPTQLAGYMQDLDADGRVNKMLAPQRRLEQMFEDLLYEKAAAALPDEFTDIKLAISLGVDYLEQGKQDKVPEKHLDRVARYLKRCKALQAKAQAASQAAAAPPPGAQPAAPVAAAA